MTSDHSRSELAVGFIMGVAYRKISALLQHRLKDYDITPEQWSVLHQIYQSDGLIQKEIADRSGKDKPTTTRIIDLLESKGLVRKQAGKRDRRSFLVFSTERGKELIRETLPIERSVTEEVKRIMDAEEYEKLMELLQRINRHFSDPMQSITSK
ncbi:MarR family transcriptional regulator [Paenibacillus phoenicis]|uniref:MarR family transcriptional regulator n=1 Tax=Paenibacillus phoenicis TaxID=554117 RepID=A0ABU5PHV4_9BACL|nr:MULTISPECIES: MarR family transcriptional regulator [Paenibacillus]EES75261.1 transcriptional regulator, MarR family [Paenibacillus sp. oral taxon 786 str. D14]MCT2193976.1 MarR family transcriptional regulator [Paenibacillus sp. p3-SID1389]MEA3569468.1 MarR family transcriptional regulator [Paenibacillus phoenicis]